MTARPLLVTVGLALVLSPAVGAQSTKEPERRDLLRQKRLEKLEKLAPARWTKIEELLLQLEQGGPLGWSYKGLYPELFTQLGTGSGFAPGLRYYKPRLLGSPFDLQAAAQVSVLNYHQHELQFGRIQSHDRRFSMPQKSYERLSFKGKGFADEARFFLFADLRYRYFPQEDFYGLSSESFKEDRTTFTLEDDSADGVIGFQYGFLTAGVRGGFLHTDVRGGTDERFPKTDDVFDETTAPGLSAALDFFRVETDLQLDFRDKPGTPHRGGVITFSFLRFDDRGGDSYRFSRVAVDGRAFVPLGSPQRVLALRLYASSDDPAPGSRAPFYLEDYLGGSHSLRGFTRNRFIDQNLLAITAEYRWEALPFVELALFYDTGKAFPDRSDFNLTDLRKSYGIGVRFKSEEAVGFRVDVAWGDEGTRLYLKFSPAF